MNNKNLEVIMKKQLLILTIIASIFLGNSKVNADSFIDNAINHQSPGTCVILLASGAAALISGYSFFNKNVKEESTKLLTWKKIAKGTCYTMGTIALMTGSYILKKRLNIESPGFWT